MIETKAEFSGFSSEFVTITTPECGLHANCSVGNFTPIDILATIFFFLCSRLIIRIVLFVSATYNSFRSERRIIPLGPAVANMFRSSGSN